jgi:signal peptidase II
LQREFKKYIFIAITILGIDQIIKYQFAIEGIEFNWQCISLTLAINKGVAFSLFAFLGKYLKWLQIMLILTVSFYLFSQKNRNLYLFATLILSAGISNILDRFTYGGVVDYVYWHCGFDFAIFNFADVVIDFAIAYLIYLTYKNKI